MQVEEIGDLEPGEEDTGLSEKQRAAIRKVQLPLQEREGPVS